MKNMYTFFCVHPQEVCLCVGKRQRLTYNVTYDWKAAK